MTWKLCWAFRPPGSETVTVAGAFPGAIALTVIVVPDMDVVAKPGFAAWTE